MPIRYVSKKQFDTFGVPAVNDTLAEEVEWFADDEAVVIGVITWDKLTRNYSIVVLGRDQHGRFGPLDTGTEFKTVEEARRKLLVKMELTLSTGVKFFPRGD